jgi:hypothetical protein
MLGISASVRLIHPGARARQSSQSSRKVVNQPARPPRETHGNRDYADCRKARQRKLFGNPTSNKNTGPPPPRTQCGQGIVPVMKITQSKQINI